MSSIVHHIVRINRPSYPAVQTLLSSQHLQELPDARLQSDRFKGVLYCPTPDALHAQAPLSDSALALGGLTLEADLHRLPSAEYAALMQRPGVRIPLDLDALSRALRHTKDEEEARQVLAQVRPSPLPLPPQLVCPTRFQAAWCPDWTQLARRGQDWFLVLYFDLSVTGPVRQPGGDEVGIDLGLSPLLSAYSVRQDLDERVAVVVPQHLLDLEAQLSGADLQRLRRVLHAWHREALERFLDHLTSTAGQVYVEELSYAGMDQPFLRKARHRGLIDWHESWLHQRLQVCGIPFERVWPHGTSSRCHRCAGRPSGRRDGSVFTCRVCGQTMDAHANAARNIAQRGMKKRALWQA